jgi:Histidine kinase
MMSFLPSSNAAPLSKRNLSLYALGFVCVLAYAELSNSRSGFFNQFNLQSAILIEFAVNAFTCAALLVAGVVISSNIRVASWLKLGVVAVVASVVTAWLDYAVLTQWLGMPSWWRLQQKRVDMYWIQPWLVTFQLLSTSILVLFVYNHREVFLRSQEALQKLQGAQTDASRKLLQARLQVMQAQIEPGFLLNTLAQVEQLYERDRERADNVMDELITYLRAAIPRMRSSSSTLGLERDLVLAYLQLSCSLNGSVNKFSFALDGDDMDIDFPPMVLTPLVSRCIENCTQITIAVRKKAADITIGIAINAAITSDIDSKLGLVEIRERLVELYGAAARVTTLITSAGTLSIRLSVPNFVSTHTAQETLMV